MHGLLPITYRQASYHIPIAIWVTRQYPREPPLAFVVPTSEMLVRPGKYIDVSGLCKIDYILNWEKKYEVCFVTSPQSNLADLTTESLLGMRFTVARPGLEELLLVRTPCLFEAKTRVWALLRLETLETTFFVAFSPTTPSSSPPYITTSGRVAGRFAFSTNDPTKTAEHSHSRSSVYISYSGGSLL